MKIVKVSLIVVILASGATFGLTGFGFLGNSGYFYVDNVPLTIELRESHFDSDGARIDSPYLGRTQAVRSDGSTVESISYRGADGNTYEYSSIRDLSIGVNSQFDTMVKAKTSYYLLPEKVEELRLAANRCPRGAVADERVFGYEVIALDKVIDLSEVEYLDGSSVDFPDPKRRSIKYFAPDLGCAFVGSSLFRIEADGAEHEIRRIEVVNLNVAQPDPSLFLVPSEYPEMSPGQVSAIAAEIEGLELEDSEITQILEVQYRENHQLWQEYLLK